MCSIPGLPTPGSEILVLITRVNLNPRCGLVELWVNMDDGRKHIYEQMREQIQSPNRRFNGSEGKPGDLCLVCISGNWHRARIVSIQSESYNVFLIDQGKPHIATCEALAWAHSDSFLLPPEIESCILANVISLEHDWPEGATKFLKSLPGKKFKGLVQDVLMPDRKILLAIPIVSKFMCKFGVPKNIQESEFKSLVLKYLHLSKGEASEANRITQEQNLKVSCQLEKHDQYFCPDLLTDTFETVTVTEVTDPQNIFCQLLIFSKAVKTVSEQIQQHYQEVSTFGEMKPQTRGDPCATRDVSGTWHRSLLKQSIMTDDGAVEVLHVDEGKTEFIPVINIRPLHRKFLRMPVVTYRCCLDGLKGNGKGWTTDQTDYLKSLLLNQTLIARLDDHNIPQDVYNVTLHTANAVCINKCFLEKAGHFPPPETEHESNVQKEPIPSSFLSSLGDRQCMDLQNGVDVNVDDLQYQSLPVTKDLEVNSRLADLSMSGTDDIQHLELPDPLIHKCEHLSTGSPCEVHNACDDDVFTVGSSINVNISCIESLQKFWCQSTENGDPLRLLMEDLQNYYASAHPQPLVESICVARNPDNDMWYRARMITSHHSPDVDVRFIDYGQTRKVPLQDVRPIDPVFLRLNAQAFQCCLFNLKNTSNPTAATWTDAALAEFQKFVESNIGLKCVVKALTSDDEGLHLNMVDIETPTDSASKLLAQKCVQNEAPVQIPPQIPLDTYNYSTHNIEVAGKEKVCVTYSESVSHFYCQLVRNSPLLDKVMENVKQIIGQPRCTDDTLGLKSICIARHTDNEWYRGQIVEMSPKLRVHFVDNGDTLDVNESDIRPFPSEGSFARFVPVQAVPLGLFDVPAEVPREVDQWFADCAIDHSWTISVVSEGENGKLLVELFNGPLNVNVKVRERILKMAQEKMTGFIQQSGQQFSSDSEQATVPHKDCSMQDLLNESVLTNITEPNKGQCSNKMCPRDELKINSQSSTNIFAPEMLDKERQSTLDVILEDQETVLARTFIEGSHNDSEIKQLSLSPCPGSVEVCMYKRPDISQNKTEEVYASCIVGPHYFWCQYANTEDLNRVSMLAQEAGQTQQDTPFPETHGPGSPCLALFPSDNQWYRAQVIKRSNDSLHVVFIDYGNECDIDIKNVRSLPQNLLEMAPRAFLCSLNGFDESKGTWDDHVYDDFYNLLVDKPLRVTVVNVEDHSEITFPQYALQIECENMIVNNAVQKYWKPVATEHVMTESPQPKNSLQCGQTETNMAQLNISKGKPNTSMLKKPKISKNQTESGYASCIVGPNFFWCQYANTEDLSKLSTLAQEAGEAQQDMMFPESLGPGSPCLAFLPSENQWYRAQVISKSNDSLHVVFIDYGNESDVVIKNVRSLPQNLLEMAPQAFLCSLNGFDESKGTWDDQVYDDFYNLLVDKPLKVTIFNLEDYSEIGVLQYSVQIECGNIVVNNAVQKYWKPVATERVMTESPQRNDSVLCGQTESNMAQLNIFKGKPKTSMYKKPDISINQTESGYASCIVGPHFFWCQYSNTEDLSKLSTLAQEAGEAQQDMMFQESLGPGSPCLALFSSDNQWYRAQAMHRTDSSLHVMFIDYGNESDVDIKNVKSLPQNLLEMAPLAFLCSLNGFDESKGTWDDQVYDDFYDLLVGKPLRMTVFNMEDHSEIDIPQYSVQIVCENMVVNNTMQKYWKPVAREEHVMTESPEPKNSLEDSQTESNMTHLHVSKGEAKTSMYKKPKLSKSQTESGHASCVVGPNFFWCQYSNTEDLSKLSILAQEAGEAQQDMMFQESLGPGSPCLALFSSDNQWYRAQAMHRTDSSLHVMFIDYGNESDVDIKNVKSLPQNLLEMAPLAFLCSLNGFDESKGTWDDQVYDDFYDLLVGKPLRVTVFNMDGQSETGVPQFAVEVECEGVVVNTLMEKYWKGLDTDPALAERFEPVHQDKTKTPDESV